MSGNILLRRLREEVISMINYKIDIGIFTLLSIHIIFLLSNSDSRKKVMVNNFGYCIRKYGLFKFL